jgi:hypothetical protein
VLFADGIHGQPTYKQLAQLFAAASGVFRPYQTQAQNSQGWGHVWNQAVAFDPAAITGICTTLGLPALACEDLLDLLQGGGALADAVRCEEVARVNPEAARRFESAGGCS